MKEDQGILKRLAALEKENRRLLARVESLEAMRSGAMDMQSVDAEAIKLLARRTARYGKGVLHDFNARR